jgi:endonuclease/exonuclease/phosphatase family metal-dependent hydrolase
MPSPRARLLLLLAAPLAACRTGTNYPSPTGPRYAAPARAVALAVPETLRVVSFNVEFSRHVDRAITVLTSEPALRAADVVLLQEMSETAVRAIADSLGLGYVYYPAIYHTRTRRQFGNAVLSRWPIADDAKITLPHVSRYARTQRIATAATLQVGPTRVRVYSAHLGTPLDIGAGARRDQLRAVLADAARYDRVVIGGDMNDGGVGAVAAAAGYAWPTARGPRTTRLGRWDHIFLRGLTAPDTLAAGTVLDARGASDHRPVWAVGVVEHGR